MVREIRSKLEGQVGRGYYSLLRATVTRLVPGAVAFDEGDPILFGRSTEGEGAAPTLVAVVCEPRQPK